MATATSGSECASVTVPGSSGSRAQSHEDQLLKMKEQLRELEECMIKQREMSAEQDRINASFGRDIAALQGVIPVLAKWTGGYQLPVEERAALASYIESRAVDHHAKDDRCTTTTTTTTKA
jgi:hypothetical protein